MEIQGWSDAAVAGAATEAGATAACQKMGRPPTEAATLQQAAMAELARRRAKAARRRAPAPIIVSGKSRLRILRELWSDPLTQGALAALLALVRMAGSRRPARAALVRAGAPAPDGLDLDAAEAPDGMKDFWHRIERMRAHAEIADLARVDLPYPHPYRHLIADLVDYADAKLLPGGRPALARRLDDPAIGLPRTAVAVLNAGSVECVTEWRNELTRKKFQRLPRRNMLLRMHQEGEAILAEHSPFLGYPEPGPPRGVWPPQPPPDDEPEGTAPGGRKLAAGIVVGIRYRTGL